MKSRPIVFDGESVRAILDGRKTQTRRVVKPQPEFIESSGRWRWPLPARARFKGCCTEVVTASREWWEYAPKEAYAYAPGDELWVRETWAVEDASKLNLPEYCGGGNPDWIYYRDPVHIGTGLTWRSPIHMPRWASRITLRVTDIRVERVQEINQAAAISEGIQREDVCPGGFDPDGFHPPGAYGYVSGLHPFPEGRIYVTAAEAFAERWDSINARRGFGWDSNPWVWVVSFAKLEALSDE